MTSYEAIYPGATFLLDPNYNFTGFRVPAGSLGATTSIQTANQLKEVNNLLNQGIKITEVSMVNPEVFEMIPKEQFKEIERLNKLTGAESSMHAPTIDPSGFTDQGWSEENRLAVQRQFEDLVIRSHDLNPKGNIPVTIHSSGIPGSTHIPDTSYLVTPEERGKGPIMSRMIAIDRETGKPINLEREKMYSPTIPEGRYNTPEQRLDMANHSKFVNAITNLAFYKKEADEILAPAYAEIAGVLNKENLTQEDIDKNKGAFSKMERANLFLENVETSFRSLYEQITKYGNDDAKKVLKEISNEWIEKTKLMQKAEIESHQKNPLKHFEIPIIKSEMIDHTLEKLREIELNPPEVYIAAEDFVKDKASETLSSIAVKSFKKFGETSPIISIENPPYGFAVASGKDLADLIKVTRNKFVEKMVKEGRSESEARDAAERLIGATWDTSHISMIRKQGFGPERVTEETKAIAPFVKHVHFNDNFGTTHTDLPPGMGDLPMKAIQDELEKAKFKGKKIFEGGNFFQHFQKSPMPYVLSHSGSPLYMGAGPYWNQLGGSGNYFSGYGPINPAMHHSIYGTSFSSLPTELGGEIPGMQSRFSGAPNR